ncbi:hypothetical protein LPJ57_005615, partial [Coemansia sp. RSA 486]
MAFNNDPESFDIHSSSQTKPPVSSALSNEIDIESVSSELSSTHLSPKQREDSSSPSDYLTIQKSDPIKLGAPNISKPKGVRQDMQPAASSGMNTPERLSPGFNPASGISQEVGTSSQLDMRAPRPGHSRASSQGNTPINGSTTNLRRNPSSLITNVDKHGGPRRRRSKTNLRSKSTS